MEINIDAFGLCLLSREGRRSMSSYLHDWLLLPPLHLFEQHWLSVMHVSPFAIQTGAGTGAEDGAGVGARVGTGTGDGAGDGAGVGAGVGA
jgi:hypothetical protein